MRSLWLVHKPVNLCYTHFQNAHRMNTSVRSCNGEVTRWAQFKRVTRRTRPRAEKPPRSGLILRLALKKKREKKAAAAVLQIAAEPYHWRGDYGSGTSSQINPGVFLCKSIEDPG